MAARINRRRVDTGAPIAGSGAELERLMQRPDGFFDSL
jgi:hypothetical protein